MSVRPEEPWFAKAYDLGRQAAKDGKTDDDNPYEPSGHDRDTTFADYCVYYWDRGFDDGNRELKS